MTVSSFKNRRTAGILLAQTLEQKVLRDPIVLALPGGGVLIADEIVKHLHLPHAILSIRNVEASSDPESTVAALAPLNVIMVDPYVQESYDISEKELNTLIGLEKRQLEQYEQKYSDADQKGIIYKTVIIVDDGLSSALTLKVAIESASIKYQSLLVIVVSPICPRDIAVAIEPFVDGIVSLCEPDDLIAINLWYDESETISETEIKKFLEHVG